MIKIRKVFESIRFEQFKDAGVINKEAWPKVVKEFDHLKEDALPSGGT